MFWEYQGCFFFFYLLLVVNPFFIAFNEMKWSIPLLICNKIREYYIALQPTTLSQTFSLASESVMVHTVQLNYNAFIAHTLAVELQ